MTTFAIPRNLPGMGGIARMVGVGALAAVLAAGATAGTVKAGSATFGHVVPGLGSYAGGRYCITQTPPFATTTTPDTVTVWTQLGGTTLKGGPYNMHDSGQVANMRAGIGRAVKIEECWEGK